MPLFEAEAPLFQSPQLPVPQAVRNVATTMKKLGSYAPLIKSTKIAMPKPVYFFQKEAQTQEELWNP